MIWKKKTFYKQMTQIKSMFGDIKISIDALHSRLTAAG